MAATLDDIRKLLAEQTTTLETKIISGVDKAKTEILDTVNNLLSDHSEKFTEIDRKIEVLTEKDLQDDVEKRQNNVIFYKVPEEEDSQEALHESMIKMLSEVIGNRFELRDINAMYRLGKKQEHVRPVIVKFVSLIKKEQVMRNRKKLLEKNVEIAEDFPIEIRLRRKNAAPIVKALKEKGFQASLKVDKIRVKGEIWSLEKAQNAIMEPGKKETGKGEKEDAPKNKRPRSPNQTTSSQPQKGRLPPLKLARSQSAASITNFFSSPATTAPRSPIVIVKTPSKNVQYTDIKDADAQ